MTISEVRFALLLTGAVLCMALGSMLPLGEVATTTTTTSTPTTVHSIEVPTTTTTLPDIRSTQEWQIRQRSLNARILRETYPERYLTTTTVAQQTIVPRATTVPASATTTTTQSTSGTIQWRPEVEQWRDLVSIYFYDHEVDMALGIIRCESVGDSNATNPYSGTAGLFQHRPQYWEDRSTRAGWAGYSIYDPRANIAVAAWLVHTNGWWHWGNGDGCEAYAREQVGW